MSYCVYDDNTFIGCGVRHNIAPFVFGFCQASVGAGETETVTCFTEDAGLLDAIKSISDYSFVTFGWNADFECTRIGNSTQSFYLSEKPKK